MLYGLGIQRNVSGPVIDRLDQFTLQALADVADKYPEHSEPLFEFAERCGHLSDVKARMREQ